MRYDVTSKNLAKKIKKDGTTSKVNDIKATYKAGNIIVTYFGEFVSVGVEQIIHISASGRQYKQWIVTLKNSSGTYRMTHNQAHKNKRIPKGAKVEQVVIAGLLPAPMELIDRLVKQVKQLGEQYTMEDVSTVASGIKQKITYISTNLQELQHPNKRNICKQIYRNLLFEYHPDRPHGSTELTLYIQRKFELWINRI